MRRMVLPKGANQKLLSSECEAVTEGKAGGFRVEVVEVRHPECSCRCSQGSVWNGLEAIHCILRYVWVPERGFVVEDVSS